MKLLAFDTSTEQLSVAVRNGAVLVEHTGAGGPQSSATLIPVAMDLLDQAGLSTGELDAIVFGRGPGSFTGLRTACSVAQGLAFGAAPPAGVPVLAVDTLMILAEMARLQNGATQVLAMLDARMDEVYSAAYAWDGDSVPSWTPVQGVRVSKPEDLVLPESSGWTLAGNANAAYGERFPAALKALPFLEMLPVATALLSLAPALLSAGHAVPADQALPLYIRDKVAQTTAERAAAGR